MRHQTLALLGVLLFAVLVAATLPGCAGTRNKPCDTISAAGNAQDLAAANTNTDTNVPIAVGDTGATVSANPSTQAVEFQINNQAAAPQFDLSEMLGGRQAANVLAAKSPTEELYGRRIARLDLRLQMIEDELDAGLAPGDRLVWLSEERERVESGISGLTAKLQLAYEQKIERAASVPGMDLSSLEQIVLNVNTWIRSGTDDNMSDAEADAMGSAFSAYADSVKSARGGE